MKIHVYFLCVRKEREASFSESIEEVEEYGDRWVLKSEDNVICVYSREISFRETGIGVAATFASGTVCDDALDRLKECIIKSLKEDYERVIEKLNRLN